MSRLWRLPFPFAKWTSTSTQDTTDLCLETLDKETHRTSGDSQEAGTGTHVRADRRPFSHSKFSGAQSLPCSFKNYASCSESLLRLAVIVLTASTCFSSVTSSIVFHFENPDFTPTLQAKKGGYYCLCSVRLLLWLTVKLWHRVSHVNMSAPIMNLL